jgi:hypothetical protein
MQGCQGQRYTASQRGCQQTRYAIINASAGWGGTPPVCRRGGRVPAVGAAPCPPAALPAAPCRCRCAHACRACPAACRQQPGAHGTQPGSSSSSSSSGSGNGTSSTVTGHTAADQQLRNMWQCQGRRGAGSHVPCGAAVLHGRGVYRQSSSWMECRVRLSCRQV